MRSRSAFTLIELLVVIAIIAILAAILFPVFAQAREKARAISCLSNEKQLGLGIMMYVEDFDEAYPPGDEEPNLDWSMGINPGVGWAGEVYSYVKSEGIYACPDDPYAAQIMATAGGSEQSGKLSYAYNQNIAAGGGTFDSNGNATSAPMPIAMARMDAPASTVVLFEVQGESVADRDVTGNWDAIPQSNPFIDEDVSASGDGTYIWPWSNTANVGPPYIATGPMGAWPNPYPDAAVYLTTGVHSGGSNFVMADGHAKWEMGSLVSDGAYNGPGSEDSGAGWGSGWSGCAGPEAMNVASWMGSQYANIKYALTFCP